MPDLVVTGFIPWSNIDQTAQHRLHNMTDARTSEKDDGGQAVSGVSPSGPDRAVTDPQRGLFDLLPWRRPDLGPEVAPVVRLVRHRHPRADVRPIVQAYEVAKAAHEGQTRKSGDAYITHPVAVAGILADLGMDVTTVTAGLLHDVIEDTGVTIEQVSEDFGEGVASIVDGVTKLDQLTFDTKEEQQAASMRKMLIAMAKDVRVLVIKLADRLHNVRTLAPLSPAKRERIAQETLDIYAPLANRLGISEMRWQLEDLAFFELMPDTAGEIVELVAERHERREEELDEILADVSKRLDVAKLKAELRGRSKTYYSIYEKMVLQGLSFDEIFDLIGVRVVVESTHDCYAVLGVVHSLWKPVQGRFKDYIAMPKFNLYQSLHTTVVGPRGRPVEVQIRTKNMDHVAEFGVAAHWRYKEGSSADSATSETEDLPWVRRLIEWDDATDPEDFLDNLRTDLYQDEVFVFTPKGDVVTLSEGATPIDFAYSVHTEVGHRCIGARVNGRLVPLDSKLASGDTIEIFTSKIEGAGPSRDWLDVVGTARARNKIRAWFSRERREEETEAGRAALRNELRRNRLPVDKTLKSAVLEEVAEEMNYQHLGALFAAVGGGHLSAAVVVGHLLSQIEPADERSAAAGEEGAASQTRRRMERRSRSAQTAGVHVEGLDDVWVHLAGCCTPVPGDEIMGYVTRGRGVSVHRADCANAVNLGVDSERVVDVGWDPDLRGPAIATVQVEALDRSGLLAEVSKVLHEHHANIRSAQTLTGRDQIAIQRFELEIGDPSRLDAVLDALSEVDAVVDAFRVLPGRAPDADDKASHPSG